MASEFQSFDWTDSVQSNGGRESDEKGGPHDARSQMGLIPTAGVHAVHPLLSAP
jgi:hypothetical protein